MTYEALIKKRDMDGWAVPLRAHCTANSQKEASEKFIKWLKKKNEKVQGYKYELWSVLEKS